MDINLGHDPAPTAQRDAIHIAVIPVTASEDLEPGQRVTISKWNGPRAYKAYDGVGADDADAPVGIVDPFRTTPVPDGHDFWLFLMPNTVTGMRHHWSHPAFPIADVVSQNKEESEAWLRRWCSQYRGCYEDLISGAVSGEGYCFGDDDGPPQYSHDEKEFWHHIEVVTGKSFDDAHRDNTPFRCAC